MCVCGPYIRWNAWPCIFINHSLTVSPFLPLVCQQWKLTRPCRVAWFRDLPMEFLVRCELEYTKLSEVAEVSLGDEEHGKMMSVGLMTRQDSELWVWYNTMESISLFTRHSRIYWDRVDWVISCWGLYNKEGGIMTMGGVYLNVLCEGNLRISVELFMFIWIKNLRINSCLVLLVMSNWWNAVVTE